MAVATTTLIRGTPLRVHFGENKDQKNGIPVSSNRCDRGRTNKLILPRLKGVVIWPTAGSVWETTVDEVTGNPTKKRGVIWVNLVNPVLDNELAGVYVREETMTAMLIVMQARTPRRKNLMLVGPMGAGKSTIVRALAKKLNARYFKVPGGLIKKPDRLLGGLSAGNDGDKLKFSFAYSNFTSGLKYAQEHPHEPVVIHTDEISRMDEDAKDGYLDVVEGESPELYLPNGEKIVVGQNVYFVCSGNKGSQYVLRRQDPAFNDRWEIFPVEYMPYKAELFHCKTLYPNAPEDQMSLALKVINHLRTCCENASPALPFAPSVRRSEAIAIYLASDAFRAGTFTLDWVVKHAIVNQYEGPLKSPSSDMFMVDEQITKNLEDLRTGRVVFDEAA